MSKIIFKKVETHVELKGAFAVRREVFITEQKIREEEEWDGLDEVCLQFIARNGKRIIGTARVHFPSPNEAKIERMAVLKAFRRQGVGTGILVCIEQELSKRGVPEAVLHAQITAAPFYRACGYDETGPHFQEAGIEHVKMSRRLTGKGS
ncbi:MAG: GNAT family N-acetyltransferase [Dehalococcoidia bacterium]|nr:GNAT family N-acetyltransferase [Dehalococcoidia bacterium]